MAEDVMPRSCADYRALINSPAYTRRSRERTLLDTHRQHCGDCEVWFHSRPRNAAPRRTRRTPIIHLRNGLLANLA